MESDRIRWDEKYKQGPYPIEVSPIVSAYSYLANKGYALDIAAGRGRNSLFLANQGFIVDAIDISHVGLSEIRGKSQNINTIQQDLDLFQPAPTFYDLVININFLKRDLYSKIISTLKVGGILIFQTFFYDPDRSESLPKKNINYYLKVNELLQEFSSLRIILYQENEEKTLDGTMQRVASLVGQKIK